ncbi:hypothetical protein ABW20_dc0104642 [Dactylellina cionopaga]|nr:hypothetical protein ABW20_dc0104642 [Dactylellina cionopaga]
MLDSMLDSTNPDPSVTEKLRKLQSRVQVWVKPTDRILTDAEAYEYDRYKSQRLSGAIPFHWAFSLTVYGILVGACAEIVGYCLLALGLAGVWWWMFFGRKMAVEGDEIYYPE